MATGLGRRNRVAGRGGCDIGYGGLENQSGRRVPGRTSWTERFESSRWHAPACRASVPENTDEAHDALRVRGPGARVRCLDGGLQSAARSAHRFAESGAPIVRAGIWEAPIWRHWSGRPNQVIQWCLGRFRAESVLRGDDAEQLEEALFQALRFAADFHEALNPEGARLTAEGKVPSREADGSKPYWNWMRTVGNVWLHDPPQRARDTQRTFVMLVSW